MSLHGHTRIELTNVHTGAVEVVEKDNTITSAVTDIFNGYGGYLNKAAMMWRGGVDDAYVPKDLVSLFYGGLLLYDRPLGGGGLFAPAAAGITGTALVKQVNSTTNTVRGSANLTETVIDPANGIDTYVYEFATNQANGVIQSVCLTHPLGALFSEMVNAPDSAVCKADRVSFNSQLGGDQLLTNVLATDYYPTTAKGVLLWADPEEDEAVAGCVDAANGVLELRRHCLSLKTFDLFCRDSVGYWVSLRRTDKLDIAGFLQCTGSSAGRYCRLCCDAEAGKFYLVSMPAASTPAAGRVVKVREYDIRTLACTDYTVPNNTGTALRGTVSEAMGTPLNGTVYGGSLYLTAPGSYQIYRFPLADPTNVKAITMHGDNLQYLGDAYAGRLYCYYQTRCVVLNTEKNELFSCEAACPNSSSAGFSTTAPVLGEPLTPLRRYYSNQRVRTERVLRVNYLGTINDLPRALEKTADKTMKIIYTLRKGV